MDLLERVFRRIIEDKELPFSEIARTVKEKYRYYESWTRKHLQIITKEIVKDNASAIFFQD